MVILDSVVRLLPGVMGKQIGHQQESFETGLLEHDHTQPRYWQEIGVPGCYPLAIINSEVAAPEF